MIVAAAGSMLPWLTFSGGVYTYSISSSGWNHDGKITVFIAAITLAFFLVGLVGRARWPFIVGLIFSFAVAGIMVYDIIDIMTTSIGPLSLSLSNVGYGLWIGAAAGVVGIIAGAGGISARRA
jgi:hypothetical protein